MKRYETITAQGSGNWYLNYEVQFVTVTRVASDLTGSRTQRYTFYEVRFKKAEDTKWDKRPFPGEAERDSFISASFTNLMLNAADSLREMPHPLGTITGTQLSAVTFPESGAGLAFAPGILIFYLRPRIIADKQQVTRRESQYEDMLRTLVGETLIDADEYLDLGLTLQFSSGLSLRVPLSSTGMDAEESSDLGEYDEVAEFYPTNDAEIYGWYIDDGPFSLTSSS